MAGDQDLLVQLGRAFIARLKNSFEFLRDDANFPKNSARSANSFSIAKKNSIARVIMRPNCAATRKIEIARDSFQRGLARSRDRREISCARRAIVCERNFLFDPRA